MEDAKIVQPINWKKMRTDEAERLVHGRSKKTENVIIGNHAFERIEERSITTGDVFTILKEGMIINAPKLNKKGDWEVVIQKHMGAGRAAGVVTIIFCKGEKLFVKTVEWMDL